MKFSKQISKFPQIQSGTIICRIVGIKPFIVFSSKTAKISEDFQIRRIFKSEQISKLTYIYLPTALLLYTTYLAISK